MPLWYILSIPKCKNIFRSALKLQLMSLKLIVFQYNSFIQTSKIPGFPRPTFQNVITHKIFEILWCPLNRIFCTWFWLIKHLNIDIWTKLLGWVFPQAVTYHSILCVRHLNWWSRQNWFVDVTKELLYYQAAETVIVRTQKYNLIYKNTTYEIIQLSNESIRFVLSSTAKTTMNAQTSIENSFPNNG
jgi:hypothetical protein